MSRLLASLLILAALAPPAATAAGKLGVQAAAVGNRFSGELPEQGSWNGGSSLGFGLVAEWNLSADVSLSLQPGFNPRRSRQEFEDRGEVIGHFDYEINYLSLPLLVRVTGDPVGVRGFVTAGLEWNFLMDAFLDVGDGNIDISDTFKDTSVGALFGAGLMVPLGRNSLTFELRYSQGLDDIVNRDGDESEQGLGSPSVKYRGLSLIAGFLFSLGGE